jgi:hypothetical protein
MNGPELRERRQALASTLRKCFQGAALGLAATVGLSAFIWTHQDTGEMFDLDKYHDKIAANIAINDPKSDPRVVNDQINEFTFRGERIIRSTTVIFSLLSLANLAFWYSKSKKADKLVDDQAPRPPPTLNL